MPKRKEPTKAQILKEIKQEIEWYQPKKSIANTMLKLGNLGFDFSGHGMGFGGEDFSFFREYPGYFISINICDTGRIIKYSISKEYEDFNSRPLLKTKYARTCINYVAQNIRSRFK